MLFPIIIISLLLNIPMTGHDKRRVPRHTAPAFTTSLSPPCCGAAELWLQPPGVMESGMEKCHTTGPVSSNYCRLPPVWLRASPESVGSTEYAKNWRQPVWCMPVPLGHPRYWSRWGM